MDPNEMTEHDIIEEAVDHIVYDDKGRDELLEVLEKYHTPNIARLLLEVMDQEIYWVHTTGAAAWRKEVEDMVRDHVRQLGRRHKENDT